MSPALARVARGGETPMSDPLFQQVRSASPELHWPPLLRGPEAVLESLLHQLDASQWQSAREIQHRQHTQLCQLAQYASRHSRVFRQRLQGAGLTVADLASPENFRRLPPLSRRDLQRGDAHCHDAPAHHHPVREFRTSGSTGEPVVVRRTAVNQLFWHALTMREYFWHERDFSYRFSAIRPFIESYRLQDDWGAPASLLFTTGPSQLIPIGLPIAEIASLLQSFAPQVLLLYPNVLSALLDHLESASQNLAGLRFIRSISETLDPALRQRASALTGAHIVENYSSQEVGIIAVQCPQGPGLHVMSESLIVEIVDDAGTPVSQGQTGRVVLTDLHNFATPLIRYVIGDYAQAGAPCACGRGLPVLDSILGRERNLVLMPDGARHWPRGGFARLRAVAPVTQYQFVQTGRETIEVRLVVERPLSAGQKADLTALIQSALGYPFALSFVIVEGQIQKGPRGKFEEFVCAVPL